MKKFIYLSAIIGGLGGLFFVQPSQAQVSISINLGTVYPSWLSSAYQDANYIYMPEYDLYYDLYNKSYVYYDNYKWVSQRNMPKAYQHIDFRTVNKVRVSERNPWDNNAYYRNTYNKKSYGKGNAGYGKNNYGQAKKEGNRMAQVSHANKGQSVIRSRQQEEARSSSRNASNSHNNAGSRVRNTR